MVSLEIHPLTCRRKPRLPIYLANISKFPLLEARLLIEDATRLNTDVTLYLIPPSTDFETGVCYPARLVTK